MCFWYPKLIATNDYQQFLGHFDWFLSLFQVSGVRPEMALVKLKVCKNGNFLGLKQGAKVVTLC